MDRHQKSTRLGTCFNELMSDIPLLTVAVMIAGFAYPPPMIPLTKLEFKKAENGFACAIGDPSDCSAVGIAEVSCDSMVCVPVDASRHFTVFDVLLLHLTREVNIRADHDPD